jgi:hypothetical protein
MICNKFVINFLIKYLFIMSAASEGWRICYIGGNQFEFYNMLENDVIKKDEPFLIKHNNINLHNIDFINNFQKKDYQ